MLDHGATLDTTSADSNCHIPLVAADGVKTLTRRPQKTSITSRRSFPASTCFRGHRAMVQLQQARRGDLVVGDRPRRRSRRAARFRRRVADARQAGFSHDAQPAALARVPHETPAAATGEQRSATMQREKASASVSGRTCTSSTTTTCSRSSTKRPRVTVLRLRRPGTSRDSSAPYPISSY